MSHYTQHYALVRKLIGTSDLLIETPAFIKDCRQRFNLPPLLQADVAPLTNLTFEVAELTDFMELAADRPQIDNFEELDSLMFGICMCEPLTELARQPFPSLDKLAVTLKPYYHQLKLKLEEGYGCDYTVWRLLGSAWLSK